MVYLVSKIKFNKIKCLCQLIKDGASFFLNLNLFIYQSWVPCGYRYQKKVMRVLIKRLSGLKLLIRIARYLTAAGGMDDLGVTLLPPLLLLGLAPPLVFGVTLLVELWPPTPPRPLPRDGFCGCQVDGATLVWGALELAPVNPPGLPPEVSRMRCHLLRTCNYSADD
jgi:hypothetical protein